MPVRAPRGTLVGALLCAVGACGGRSSVAVGARAPLPATRTLYLRTLTPVQPYSPDARDLRPQLLPQNTILEATPSDDDPDYLHSNRQLKLFSVVDAGPAADPGDRFLLQESSLSPTKMSPDSAAVTFARDAAYVAEYEIFSGSCDRSRSGQISSLSAKLVVRSASVNAKIAAVYSVVARPQGGLLKIVPNHGELDIYAVAWTPIRLEATDRSGVMMHATHEGEMYGYMGPGYFLDSRSLSNADTATVRLYGHGCTVIATSAPTE